MLFAVSRHFSKIHRRGPEEVWYRRAALHPNLTVVTSGPVLPTFPDDVNLEQEWQEISKEDMIVTVSKAVVVDGHKGHHNIPAVVGMQFQQQSLQGVFDNITRNQWVSLTTNFVQWLPPRCRFMLISV